MQQILGVLLGLKHIVDELTWMFMMQLVFFRCDDSPSFLLTSQIAPMEVLLHTRNHGRVINRSSLLAEMSHNCILAVESLCRLGSYNETKSPSVASTSFKLLLLFELYRSIYHHRSHLDRVRHHAMLSYSLPHAFVVQKIILGSTRVTPSCGLQLLHRRRERAAAPG